MENPVTTVKKNLSVGKIFGFAILALAVFAIADATNITGWVLYPVSSIRNKFKKPSA